MMKRAVIDLGTTRYCINRQSPEPEQSMRFQRRISQRLGEGVFDSGQLGTAAIERTMAVLNLIPRLNREWMTPSAGHSGPAAPAMLNNSEI
jgi:exopolyphosphatase/pppGpp-phosphohydrolase